MEFGPTVAPQESFAKSVKQWFNSQTNINCEKVKQILTSKNRRERERKREKERERETEGARERGEGERESFSVIEPPQNNQLLMVTLK